MNLWGNIRIEEGGDLSRHNNFKTWPQAMVALFRMTTGGAWTGMMQECMRTNE